MSTAQIVFNKFDTDNSGSIDVKEFQALCYNLGYMLTQAEIKYAVLSLDKDGRLLMCAVHVYMYVLCALERVF